jgi:hypothetical protein
MNDSLRVGLRQAGPVRTSIGARKGRLLLGPYELRCTRGQRFIYGYCTVCPTFACGRRRKFGVLPLRFAPAGDRAAFRGLLTVSGRRAFRQDFDGLWRVEQRA